MKFNKREVSNGGSDSSLYLRLKDGDKSTGICRGEIYEFQILWKEGKSVVVESGGKPRFKVNFVVYEEGRFIAKIWEFGVTVYNQLADIHELYPLDKTKIRVSRNGSSKENTSYNILPILNEPLSEKMLSEISKVQLVILNHKKEIEEPLFPPEPDPRDYGNHEEFF